MHGRPYRFIGLSGLWRAFPLLLLLPLFLGSAARAESTDAVTKAKRLHLALTAGIPLLDDRPYYARVVSQIEAGDVSGAAATITTNAKEFLNYVVPRLVRTWNKDGTSVADYTDLAAKLLVIVRDGRPLSDFLTGNFIAYDPTKTPAGVAYAIDDSGCGAAPGTPGTSCNSAHYSLIWSLYGGTNNKYPSDVLQVTEHPGFQGIGHWTDWGWQKEAGIAGTARRNTRLWVESGLCSSMDAMRTVAAIPTAEIAQDVPFNDPQFNSNCVHCHKWQDDWRHAYLSVYVDANQKMSWVQPVIDKLNSPSTFGGAPVTDSSFNFFFTDDQNNSVLKLIASELPIQSYAGTNVHMIPGHDLKDFAAIWPHSMGFYECMVKRVIAQVWMGKDFSFANFTTSDFDILNSQANTIKAFAERLHQTQDLRDTFHQVAIQYFVNN